MREEFITELKPGDIFKLDSNGIDVNRIVTGVTIEQSDFYPYPLVRIYYAFANEYFDDTICRTNNTWASTKKVYKVSI